MKSSFLEIKITALRKFKFNILFILTIMTYYQLRWGLIFCRILYYNLLKGPCENKYTSYIFNKKLQDKSGKLLEIFF